MIRQIFWAAAITTAVACVSKSNGSNGASNPADPWSACATAGPAEYGEQPANCTSASCRQCASVLSQAWRDREQPAWRGKFDARFLRSSVGAREMVIQQAHPEGEFAFQHCTAAMASGARCAAYSDACATVIAAGVADTSDNTARRDAARTALRNACAPARRATLRELQHCETFAPGPRCSDDACRACVDHQVAVVHTLTESLPAESLPAAFDAMAHNTPPTVANDLMNRFPERQPPADITQEVADQVVHSYCFQTREDADYVVPPRCLQLWGEILTHADHPEHAAAWAVLAAAGPRARQSLLVTALVPNHPEDAFEPFVLEHLRTLPLAGTREAMAMVMGAVVYPTARYDALRQIMVDRGVTGTDLPPAVQANPPRPGARPRASACSPVRAWG